MPEKIEEVNILQQSNQDMTSYSIYVARLRALPDPRDGLKPVHRRIMYALFKDLKSQKHIKTARVSGTVIGKYHPHGNTSVEAAIKPLTNWFEIYKPLLDGQGSFGNIRGDGASAPRYTETWLSEYGKECIIGDMNETELSADWVQNYDGTTKEPECLPAKVPNLLINGAFSIAVGLRTAVPKHNINEVIDAAIHLIHHPDDDIVLVPDDCEGCDIVNTDFASISKTGKGKFRIRSKIEISEFNKHPALKITSLPSLTFFNTIEEQIGKMIEANELPQIIDIHNASYVDKTSKSDIVNEVFVVYIELRKDADPYYVREVLFNRTDLEKTFSVNFETIFNKNPVMLNYKTYLQIFLDFRKERKLRLYQNRLMDCKTRMHEMALYIKVMEQPKKLNELIKMIRQQKGTDDSQYIDYLVKEMGVSPLQARFLLGVNIKKLSIGYLEKYKQIYAEATKQAEEYFQYTIHPEKIFDIIEQELLDIKKKYGEPRRSNIISVADGDSIPKGIFRVVITEKGFIKKVAETGTLGLKDDKARFVMRVDNTDTLLLFSRLGKVYSIPIHKIPFSNKSGSGSDMRTILKKYTGDGICSIVTQNGIKTIRDTFANAGSECNMFMVTADGLFKRMELEPFFDIPVGGLVYTRLNEGDVVADIVFMSPANQMLIYSNNKVLRIKGSDAPLLGRPTKGNIAMKSKHSVDGFSCLVNDKGSVIVLTESGRINKVSIATIPLTSKGRVGNNIIKLGKNDSIKKITICSDNDVLHINTNKNNYDIIVKDIPMGSSISGGAKLVDASGILTASVERH